MPTPASGSVRVASQCHFERYEEGKITSIFQMHDKVEVNDIPNMQSGITSQYEINKLTVNGHEIKVGQYLIRVGSALFVVDDPELCGIAIRQWCYEESHAIDAALYAIENLSPTYRDRWRRGQTIDRIISDECVEIDEAARQRQMSFSRPSRRYTESGAEIHPNDVERYRGRTHPDPRVSPVGLGGRRESALTLDPDGPALDRAAMSAMLEHWRRQ